MLIMSEFIISDLKSKADMFKIRLIRGDRHCPYRFVYKICQRDRLCKLPDLHHAIEGNEIDKS